MTNLLLKPFSDYFSRVLQTDIQPRTISHFQIKFIEGGLLLAMLDWIQDSKEYTQENMADIILDLLNIKLSEK